MIKIKSRFKLSATARQSYIKYMLNKNRTIKSLLSVCSKLFSEIKITEMIMCNIWYELTDEMYYIRVGDLEIIANTKDKIVVEINY